MIRNPEQSPLVFDPFFPPEAPPTYASLRDRLAAQAASRPASAAPAPKPETPPAPEMPPMPRVNYSAYQTVINRHNAVRSRPSH